jgi:hypothetical protein
MDQARTRAEELIEELMRQLDPESPRYRVLASARQFKSSWVDLGDKLTGVQRKQLYRDWGYAGFEDYCSKEIRIRRQTAQKLTQAFRYLEQEAPEYLDPASGLNTLPDFRSVDLLRQAREEQEIDADDFGELRRAVLDEQRSLPTIRRQFNRLLQGHEPPEMALRRRLDSALQAARRFRSTLAEIPDQAGELPARVEKFESELKNLLECALPGPEETPSA